MCIGRTFRTNGTPGTQTIRRNKIIAILGNKIDQYTVLFVLAFTVYSDIHM